MIHWLSALSAQWHPGRQGGLSLEKTGRRSGFFEKAAVGIFFLSFF